jgi:hypothetical protein
MREVAKQIDNYSANLLQGAGFSAEGGVLAFRVSEVAQVRGNLVEMSAATDGQVRKTVADSLWGFGTALQDCGAGEILPVVVGGRAPFWLAAGISPVRGGLLYASSTVGRANITTSPPSPGTEARILGICETSAGAAGSVVMGVILPAKSYPLPVVVALTDGANIALDASLGYTYAVTLGGNRTLSSPTNPLGDGQRIILRVRQDGTGSRTLAYGAKYRFGTSIPSPTLTTGANKTDYLGFIYSLADDKWDLVGLCQGF